MRKAACPATRPKLREVQDDHGYEAWEALWTPMEPIGFLLTGTIRIQKKMFIVYDNRSRISTNEMRKLHLCKGGK
jgi:hypothetical protein